MPKQIIIAEQHRIAAVFAEDQIQELVVATGSHQVGDIYLGVIENVLPGIDAAFVNIGDSARNGFIHVTDLGPLRLKRTASAITELLAPQQKVLVQVMKEPTGNKGPRLTGNITLPGRYVVLMPFGRGVNLSRRIRNEAERNRLRALAVLTKPAGMGLLVRTEAEGKAEEAIIEDLELLQKQWESIEQEANSTRAPALLNRDDDFIQRVLRDMYTADVNRIVVDAPTGVKRVKQYLLSWSGGKSPEGVLIDHHRERLTVLEYFRVNAAIREALKPRVELPSGGYIIIEPTEALTVIDVNSGSFTRSATARETVLWTNCEAATEIARQLRLRNLAGVIIVDFIDMDARRDQLQVLEHFNKQLRADKARPQIAQLSELGLVELTRKRMGQNIYELFGHSCPTCGGLGHLVRLPGEASRNGETVEPAAPIPVVPATARENRIPSYNNNNFATPETPASNAWEELTDTFEVEEDQSFETMPHSGYPERPSTGKNRRRRNSRIIEAPGREESGRANPRIGGRTPVSDRFKADLTAEPEEAPAPAPEPFTLIPREAEPREKPQRLKPLRQESEPPEVVGIEMTPEEQDVYALMGISPIVRIDRPLKNPKSAIINVVSPGESTTESAKVEAPAPSLESPKVEAPVPSLELPKFEAPAPSLAELPVEEAVTPVVTPTPTPEPEPVAPAMPAPELSQEANVPLNRRRRRRSSASGSDETE